MTIEDEFAKLRESAQQEAAEMAVRFKEKNADVTAIIEQLGAHIEYSRDRDHLYVTVGEPRAAMAFFGNSSVLLVEPETLEFLGIEIPDFSKAVRTGAFRNLKPLLSFLEWQPVVHIPPAPHDEGAAFSREVAQGVHQVLALA